MKTLRDFLHPSRGMAISVIVALLALVLFAAATVAAADKADEDSDKRDQSTITTGTGVRYQTTVNRHTEGSLSSEDLHQASLLTSRIVNHLNEAVKGLIDQDPDTARSEIEHADRLKRVVRELLPVTTVTTFVKNAKGEEVYCDVDTIQDDKIALYTGMIAKEVVEPIIDAKETEAALKGLRLADAEVIHTSVLADLSYIERKLDRAKALLDNPEEALAQLHLAQTRGIHLSVDRVDDPLVTVQHALRLAERMVEEDKHEAAQENLRLAQIHLGTYRALLAKDKSEVVRKLEDDIADLIPKTTEEQSAARIRDFWERAVNWFQAEPGQAHVVEDKQTKMAKN